MRIPVVALVGRPNVGKSTLFNRMLRRREAVVHDTPGVTRDRHAGLAHWSGRSFYLIDTGGWFPGARDGMEKRVADQVLQALAECDAVLFIADAREGLQTGDEEISRSLRRLAAEVPVILAVNKCDSDRWETHAHEFARLGWPESHPISATEGRGIGELLDTVIARLPASKGGDEAAEGLRIAILGRPNVGKSSLTNRLIGEERVIVDATPGTTRDAIDVVWRWQGRTFWLIDTAGIRHRWDRLPGFEFYASLRSIRALDRCDIALLLLDAAAGVTRQDQRIASLIHDSGRPALIIMNKWDLIAKETDTMKTFETTVRNELPFLDYAPLIFISTVSGQRIGKIPEQIVALHEAAQTRVSTPQLNSVLQRAIDRNPPRGARGQRPPRLLYATQVRVGPPVIALFTRRGDRISRVYLRYLSRRFREAFGFKGSPLRLTVRGAPDRPARTGPRGAAR